MLPITPVLHSTDSGELHPGIHKDEQLIGMSAYIQKGGKRDAAYIVTSGALSHLAFSAADKALQGSVRETGEYIAYTLARKGVGVFPLPPMPCSTLAILSDCHQRSQGHQARARASLSNRTLRCLRVVNIGRLLVCFVYLNRTQNPQTIGVTGFSPLEQGEQNRYFAYLQVILVPFDKISMVIL